MKAAYNTNELRNFWRILPLVPVALALAGPPRLWGQSCTVSNPGTVSSVSVSVTPSAVTIGTGGFWNLFRVSPVLTATITVSPAAGYIGDSISVGVTIPPNVGTGPLGFLWSPVSNDFAFIPCGQNSTTLQFVIGLESLSQDTVATFSAEAGTNNFPPASNTSVTGTATFQIDSGFAFVSPGNLGVCPSGASCKAGAPINLTDGNTWISQRDYSVPGLGGGLELSRVWNSRWVYANPPAAAGMFGYGWRSTYEEALAGPDSNNNITYWRGDGSGWTFTYNSTLNSFTRFPSQ